MAVVMLLKNNRFSQKASLRRKEVRKRAWARSALKLAIVAGVIPCARLVSKHFCLALPTRSFACRFRPPSGEPAGTDGASSKSGRRRTARHFGPTVRGCNAARRKRRPRGGPGYEARQRKYPVRPVSEYEDTSKMPKMKTKSGAKKRFKMTATGKVKAGQAGKRHGMIKRTAKFIQTARGTGVLNESDAKIVKKYMPYAR